MLKNNYRFKYIYFCTGSTNLGLSIAGLITVVNASFKLDTRGVYYSAVVDMIALKFSCIIFPCTNRIRIIGG